MALLPVYEWAGVDDDLTARQEWMLNVAGLVAVLLVAHVLGWVDLMGVSADVLTSLPGGSMAVVAVIAFAAAFVVVSTVSDRDIGDTAWVVAAATAGFFLIDLFYLHPHVFDNVPALFYWLAKPIWVGIPMFAAAMWLAGNTGLDRRLVYTVSGVIGIVVLQLYYTVIPIPTVSGESIQIGLTGNLVVGVPIHGGALLFALAVVVVAITGRRWL